MNPKIMSNFEKPMYKKAALTLAFFIILTFTYLFLIGTLNLRGSYYFSPFLQSLPPKPNWVPPCHSLPPLKVYMYDLPRRFNVGMFRKGSTDQTPVTAKTLPPWPKVSGLRKQHSVEYWMMASLFVAEKEGIKDNDLVKMEAVRVLDPEIADVFFVPFFSSLSFNFYGHNMTDPNTKHDKELQVDILKFLRKSKYWQRSEGRDHVIPMHHPNAFRFLREQVNKSILVVADFGRYPRSMSNLKKDVVAPYVHVVDSYTNDETADPFESRTTLLYFRGRTVRKDDGVVRAKLQKLLEDYVDVRFERSVATEANIKLSTKGMRLSKFCLHPAGDTPSSCRLFDAIASHCVPVIISDQIELPFEDEIDYTEFSLFFSTDEALKPGYLIEQLRQFPKVKWLTMWNKLKNVSKLYEFQYPPKSGDAVNMIWRQVRHKLPSTRLAVHRTRRLKIPDWWGSKR
ncbi:unnamed protein product [Amaranthus hypochondriacus]